MDLGFSVHDGCFNGQTAVDLTAADEPLPTA